MPKLKKKSDAQKRNAMKNTMIKKRIDSEIKNKLREIDRKSKAIKRQDANIRINQNLINSLSQKKRLSDSNKAAAHKARLRENQNIRLINPQKREQHRERERECQENRLRDCRKREQHRQRDRASHSVKLRDPVKREQHRERDRASHSVKLRDPVKREQQRERERECQARRLRDSGKREQQRERERECQARRLRDPAKREQQRERERECQAIRLRDSGKREQHRERLKSSQKARLENVKKLRRHLKNLKKYNKKIYSHPSNKSIIKNKALENYKKKVVSNINNKKIALIKTYKKMIKDGPFWPCACCDRIFFKHSVRYYTINDFPNVNIDFVLKCCLNRENDSVVGYLCTSCRKELLKGQVPKLSLFYTELIFPPMPPELATLTNLEERFLAPRIPFMQIYSVGGNQQFSVKGRVVNVPTEVQENINILPRLPQETDVVAVALKKNKSYRSNYLFETVRPNIVLKALKYLVNCPAYKEAGVAIDYSRIIESPFFISQNAKNDDLHSPDSSDSEPDPQPWNIPDNETFLLSEAIVFAPGENFKPLPLFLDSHAESLSFIKLYCGQVRHIPKHLTYQNWVKSEIMRSDRRCALISKLFYCTLKLRAQKIASSIGFCLRKTKGLPNLNAQQLLSENIINQLALHNSGFKLFTPDRGSPAFWEEKKREVFAQIRMLGPPTFFITLSPAETKWAELIVILKKVVDKENISEFEALELSYEEKARLIKVDPVTCARYFDYRMRNLMSLLKNPKTFFTGYPIIDSYIRVEFQQRGSPHIHGLLWLQNAPRFKEGDTENNLRCADFINRFVTCCTDSIPTELLQFQTHRHTFTCKGNYRKGKKCRFGIPYFPMSQTFILEPLEDSFLNAQKEILKNKITNIRNRLNIYYKEGTDLNFFDFLKVLEMSESEYILAVRSTLKRPTVFLKRSPSDIRINGFNKEILEVHRANMDLQFITDTYSCAMYVLNYINKSKRGISRLLRDAQIEVRQGNYTIREQLRFMANKFLNASEFSAQEAVYYLLSLPLSVSSRPCIFINTSRPENRVLVVKSRGVLKQLSDNDTDVFCKNIIDHYIQRPDCLDGMCLAEFAGYYNYSSRRYGTPKIKSDDELSEDQLSETVGTCIPLKDKSGFITRRRKSKIIRYPRFNILNDEENYFREQLMLFIPWRDEDKDLISVNACEKFLLFKDSLINNRSKFIYTDETNNDIEDIIEAATRAHQNLQTDSDEENLEINSKKIQTEFEVLNDRVNEGDILVDIGADLGNKTDITLPVPYLVSDDRYNELVTSLNDKQRRYLIHLLHLMKTSSNPIYECILGGAGVGKSRLIETIYQTVLRYLNKSSGTDLTTVKVLLCAPTGKAAFAIKGVTLHSAFALPLNQFSHAMPPLSCSVSNTLLSQLHQLKLIIMDEVSMIGSRTLGQIDERLKQIFRSDKLFAGKSIILLGDFNQLAPVGDRHIFQPDSRNDYGDLIGNPLWDLFSFFELTEIMRQRDDLLFATALNNLAVGSLSPEEVTLFKSRVVKSSSDVPENALRLFRTNAEVHAFNESIFMKCSDVVIVTAVDKVLGNVSDAIKQKLINSVQASPLHKTYSLPMTLKLVINVHYMVTNNISVTDGIVNGAVGILKFIELNSDKDVVRLWMHFDEPQVGKECRNAFLSISSKLKLDPTLTPIAKVSRNIRPWEKSPAIVSRSQFPVIPAEAITIHKSQGGTYESVAVHLKSGFRRNELYVAFSRVTKITGLYIVGNFKPPNPPKPDDLIQTTIGNALISKLIKFSVPFLQDFSGMSIVFHNVQSLNAHFPHILADKSLTSASLIILVETWSIPSDIYDIPNYTLVHRVDVKKNYRHGFGIMVFCQCGLSNQVEVVTQFNKEEKDNNFNLVLLKFQEIFICAGYKSPSTPITTFENSIAMSMNEISDKNSKLIVLGDFNKDILKSSLRMFSTIFKDFKLENKIINTPSTDGLTQLDVCFSNIPLLKASYYESYFSYHKAIVCIFSDILESNNNKKHLIQTPVLSSNFLEDVADTSLNDAFILPPRFSNLDGVSCYANSACQALLSLNFIREALLDSDDSNELLNIASEYRSTQVLSTKELRTVVANRTNSLQFVQNEQQDVVEFISLLLYAFPLIKSYCDHKITFEYSCQNCIHYTNNSQENLVIPISRNVDLVSLSNMFASDYGCWKPVDALCPSCGSKNLESKQSIELHTKTKFLIIQLGVFEYSSTGVIRKNNFEFNNLCSEEIIVHNKSFNVSAIISHHGTSTNSGHYTCNVRLKNNTWAKTNDSNVALTFPDSDDAYVLLLTQKN